MVMRAVIVTLSLLGWTFTVACAQGITDIDDDDGSRLASGGGGHGGAAGSNSSGSSTASGVNAASSASGSSVSSSAGTTTSTSVSSSVSSSASGGMPCIYCTGTCATITADAACWVDCIGNQGALGCIWQNNMCLCVF